MSTDTVNGRVLGLHDPVWLLECGFQGLFFPTLATLVNFHRFPSWISYSSLGLMGKKSPQNSLC